MIEDPLFLLLAGFGFSSVASAFSGLWRVRNSLDLLFHARTRRRLTKSEETRLDELMQSGRTFHNYAFIFAGATIGLSAIEPTPGYTLPFASVFVSQPQLSIGLHFLLLICLVAADRFFLMALPWLRIDTRRPPFSWLVLGFAHQSGINLGIWFYVPMLLSSIGVATSISGTSQSFSYSAVLSFSFLFMYLPRVFYYWSFYVSRRLDHRGGSATFSIFLLYLYRMIRQALVTSIFFAPIVLLIPRWNTPVFQNYLITIVVVFLGAYLLRLIFGLTRAYKFLDRFGTRFGFVMKSRHY